MKVISEKSSSDQVPEGGKRAVRLFRLQAVKALKEEE